VRKIIDEFLDLRDKVDEQIREMLNDIEHDTLLKGIRLTPFQASLEFKEEAIPEDSAYRMCVFCKHFNTNTVAENEGMNERNDRRLSRDQRVQAVWSDFDKRRAEAEKNNEDPPPFPKHPISGKELRRKPPVVSNKDLESPMVQCMCSTATCNQEGTDIGSSCFVKCLKSNVPVEGVVDPQASLAECFPWTALGRARGGGEVLLSRLPVQVQQAVQGE